MARIFSYAFTTAGNGLSEDGSEGGPYVAQHIGGAASIDNDDGAGEGNLFREITRKGIQTGLGTFFGLGYGLPMSKLYAKCVNSYSIGDQALTPDLLLVRYFGGSLDFLTLDGWGDYCRFVFQP